MLPVLCRAKKDSANKTLVAEIEQSGEFYWLTDPTVPYFLVIEEGRLGLAGGFDAKMRPVFVDFMSAALNYRRAQPKGAERALAQATGLLRQSNLVIHDATAGLGRDAFVLASLGARVQMFERHPVLQWLLQDGITRLRASTDASLHAIAQRFHYQPYSYLEADLPEGPRPDVVFLDPMFPEKSTRARVKKEMQLLREVVQQDTDAHQLLRVAIKRARYRVVVKRPRLAPCLANEQPSMTLSGKSNRFDIYINAAVAKT